MQHQKTQNVLEKYLFLLSLLHHVDTLDIEPSSDVVISLSIEYRKRASKPVGLEWSAEKGRTVLGLKAMDAHTGHM